MAMFGPKQLVPGLVAVLGLAVLVQPASPQDPAQADPAENPTHLINRVLADAWKSRNLTPPRKTTDAEFASKLYKDLHGRVPTAPEVLAFEQQKGADKRTKLIEQLLAEKQFGNHWANQWSNMLLPEKYNKGYREEFHKWLADRFATNASYADTVRAMLTANGKTGENGAVHFILANVGTPLPEDKRADSGQFDMVPVTEQTGRVFLGLGFQCLACHHHPFTASLTQREFWGVNAFFRQVERVGEPCEAPKVTPPLELKDNSKWNADGVVRYKRRTGFTDATGLNFPIGRSPRGGDERSRREMLAEFVLRYKNFSPNAVNRVWSLLLPRNLMENAGNDDIGDSNEPLYLEIMTGLSNAFRDSGYDQKKLIAWICNSDVYQLHTTPGDKDDPYFFSGQKPQLAPKPDPNNPCTWKR